MVNSNLEWKALGTLTKTNTEIALPSTFNEVFVYVRFANGIGTQILIPRNVLGSSIRIFSNGYYASNASQLAASVSCKPLKIIYGWAYMDGVEVDNATFNVYYR